MNFRAALALVRRPDLWWTGARQALRLAAPGWWRRGSHLPLPDDAYMHFRLVTQYGGDSPRATGGDLIQYLEWCRGEKRRR
ncbi:MAG TPA: hypothetical protein VMZ22_04660 [Acidimicrobiales bacterium]|nr:hypothetical protein [Acidimicrobiales bacterium]